VPAEYSARIGVGRCGFRRRKFRDGFAILRDVGRDHGVNCLIGTDERLARGAPPPPALPRRDASDPSLRDGRVMLELSPDQNLINLAWDEVAIKARLPEDMEDSFERLGLTPRRSACRRAYQRFFIRGKAILRWHETHYGVYSSDASRRGIRFLSPVELPPRERARIRLPNTKEFHIEVVRCHRLDECCYDCGAVFVLGK
jgi:hypothetical protein